MTENSTTPPQSDPISLAKEIGRESMSYIGERVFEILELSYLSRFLQPLEDEGYETFRTWIDPFIYGIKGTLKDVMTERFFTKCVPSTVSYSDMTSCSLEKFFGSIRNDFSDIISPAFWNKDFCLITELLSFMDFRDLKRELGTLNKILEGNTVSRSILGFGNAKPELIEKYKNGYGGLFFDGEFLKYKPQINVIICSHLLDPLTINLLYDNAFFDRVHLVQYSITNSQAEELLKEPLKRFPIEKMAELRSMNEVWKEKLSEKKTHIPKNYEDLASKALEFAKGKAEKEETAIIDLYSFRPFGHIFRESICREAVGNTEKIDFGKFIFSKEEIKSVDQINPAFIFNSKSQHCFQMIDDLLRASGSMKSGDLLNIVQPHFSSTRTIYKVLKNPHFYKPEYGVWAIKPKEENKK